ncbi:MAG TPA: hypothetical protein VJN93_14500 [Candidatus Acidoferrum sp.]|nr:hypothetical protein [Candidatus Acidoferrum sp.]
MRLRREFHRTKGVERERQEEEGFHREKPHDGEAFLSAQADTFAGANVKKKRRLAAFEMTGGGGWGEEGVGF